MNAFTRLAFGYLINRWNYGTGTGSGMAKPGYVWPGATGINPLECLVLSLLFVDLRDQYRQEYGVDPPKTGANRLS